MSVDNTQNQAALARWRLVLGRFAERALGSPGDGRYQQMDRVLDYLYGREYAGRGVRDHREIPDGQRSGGMGASQLTVPDWIREVRDLFPMETVEVIQRHALDRYGMTELVTDPQVLENIDPSYDLLKAVLSFKGMMKGRVLDLARRIVKQVVDDLTRKLSKEIRRALWGKLNRRQRTTLKCASNLDFKRTIRSNLKNYDLESKRIVLQNLYFYSRTRRHMPWHIIMAVDCSGSMADSVIHSAIMAGIFRGLPSMRVSLLAFDTSIIDFTEQVDDPTEVLMSVQLGGGTDIAKAIRYCETLVQQPHRTILVLVTDFYEGGSPEGMIASIKRLREAGVVVLGLAALGSDAVPVYDHEMAERCVAAGAEIAALTPQRLAEWLATIIS
ncbi:MAG: VWA domain-containing protein [Armatimonadota bacterium]